MKGVRDTLEMYATGRPKINYVEADQRGRHRLEPYVIVADRVRFKGSDRIWAGGKVTIDRSDFAARERLDAPRHRGRQRRHADRRASRSCAGSAPTASGSAGKRIDLALEQRELS